MKFLSVVSPFRNAMTAELWKSCWFFF